MIDILIDLADQKLLKKRENDETNARERDQRNYRSTTRKTASKPCKRDMQKVHGNDRQSTKNKIIAINNGLGYH